MVYNALFKKMKLLQGSREHECERIDRLKGKNDIGSVFDFSTEDIIRKIDNGQDQFFAVDVVQSVRAPVRVVSGKTGKYLRSSADHDKWDNLLNLPDFT